MPEPAPPPESLPQRLLPPWAGRCVRLLAVVLFLFVAWLTLPKLPERMKRLVEYRAARAEMARDDAGSAPLAPDEVVRPTDVLLIAVVALGGGGVLLSLGYLALRRPGALPEVPSAGQQPRE